jgi:hypothetical protein
MQLQSFGLSKLGANCGLTTGMIVILIMFGSGEPNALHPDAQTRLTRLISSKDKANANNNSTNALNGTR